MTIPEMLSRNARMYPDDCALVELKPGRNYRREVTWRQMDDEANRVANALIDMGVKKGDRIIQWMMNSIDWLISYFGILRSGAWVVPLNFRFTTGDFLYCAEISGARFMIAGEEFIERIDAAKKHLGGIEGILALGGSLPGYMTGYHDWIGRRPTSQPRIDISRDEACSLYFTSGTTGAPKPILLTHDNLRCAAVTEYAHHLQQKSDNFVLIPPLYHTGSKMHWFGSLITGGRATLLGEVSPRNILETVHRERGTIVWLLVPWAHDILVALEDGQVKKEDYDLSCWRLMHIGAQPVPPSLIKRWMAAFPGMQYDTNYGLSEASGPGCVHLGVENIHKVGAIGKAGFNWESKIVGENGEVRGAGSIGELLVRGEGVMKEYYKNPEKTAEALHDGWLHTGDMANMDEDGFIYLVDRKKDVIITGGENIFPVEVEDAIHNLNSVKDVAVIGIPDQRLGEIAIAIVDRKPGVSVSEEEIIQYCMNNLARHKVPRKVIFDRVPRNPTGKIEKPGLREKYKPLDSAG
ncbi:MAG: AMP-binding protein [Dehalococcoidia bacterium]